MNKRFVIFNLKEAKEELDRTIKEIQENKAYDFGEFVVAMSHLYHHLNTAWNAQDASEKEADECSDENFNKWRKFPKNKEFGLDA